MKEKLYLYYTNDLHSNFDTWPKVATFLKKEKQKRQKKNDSFWLLDVGDHMDRVHPITEATMGQANVELLNELEYDFITIGNNEGITLPHQTLYNLYDQALFKVVCANLNSLTEQNPRWIEPIITVKSIQGVRVGLIGLTVPFNAFYHLLDWHIDYPDEVLEHYMPQLKKSTDVIVLLSHLGINDDRRIAERFTEIDVIVGGHTHHLFRTEENVEQTIITAAGRGSTHVGKVILTWDHENQTLIHKEAYAINITHLNSDHETVKLLKQHEEKASDILQQEVVTLNNPLEVNWFQETPIIRELTQTLRTWTGADISMLNAGILLESLPAGRVTYGDVHRICPHPINPSLINLNGDELLEVIRVTYTNTFMNFELEGFGFRGKVLGKMVFSNLEIETDMHEDGTLFVDKVTFFGEPLKSDKTYSMATADTFTFGRLLPEIAKAAKKMYFLPEFMRDLLRHALKNI